MTLNVHHRQPSAFGPSADSFFKTDQQENCGHLISPQIRAISKMTDKIKRKGVGLACAKRCYVIGVVDAHCKPRAYADTLSNISKIE